MQFCLGLIFKAILICFRVVLLASLFCFGFDVVCFMWFGIAALCFLLRFGLCLEPSLVVVYVNALFTCSVGCFCLFC